MLDIVGLFVLVEADVEEIEPFEDVSEGLVEEAGLAFLAVAVEVEVFVFDFLVLLVEVGFGRLD